MTHHGLAALAACLAAGATIADAASGGAILPPTISVTLPAGADEFPGGEAARAVNGNCLACHSTEMVLTQPALSKATWTQEVTKMRKVYGAPIADADVQAIVDYLAALRPR